MVAERDAVGARAEDLVGGILGDAEAGGGVLAVDHHEIEVQAAAEARQMVAETLTAGPAHHVAEESKAHQTSFSGTR